MKMKQYRPKQDVRFERFLRLRRVQHLADQADQRRLLAAYGELDKMTRDVLHWQGVPAAKLTSMTDEELLAVPEIGPARLRHIRKGFPAPPPPVRDRYEEFLYS